jgi:GNAT superfamily N-acetyltransferase
MDWTFSEDVEEFAAMAGGFLSLRPAENTIELGVAEAVRRRGPAAFGGSPPLFGWWRHAGGPVQSTFLHTPPYPGLLTSGAHESSVRPLAEGLAGLGRPLPGINAEETAAMAFSAAWQQLTGTGTQIGRRSRLYRLGELQLPAPAPPGAARVAVAADSELLEAWLDAFSRELAGAAPPIPGIVADRLGHGGLTLWEKDGVPVSLAGLTRPAGGIVRVAPVYTPPEHRQHGYGAAVTAAVSRAALDGGATAVVLFTDLANPTSNSLYQRLGYRRVEDRVIVEFQAVSTS